MPYPWFKFYGAEYLSDVKMRALTPCARSCWITLLSFASVASTPGKVSYLTEEALMREAGLNATKDEWSETEGVLKLFEKRKMIEITEESINVVNWDKRQDSYLTDAERSSRYRHGRVTRPSRSGMRNVTLDKEEDRDIDKNNTFEHFWEVYPRKIAKKTAKISWLKSIKMTKPDVIIAGLERSKLSSQWMKDDGQFIPHPSTWLNQERWTDEGPRVITKKPDRF